MKPVGKTRLLWLALRTALVTLLIGVPCYFLLIDQVFSHAVARAEELGFKPGDSPKRAVPEKQVEGHTCGWHGIRSLYRAHGLDPDDHALRLRLGVDRGAVPAMGSTQGTLQPDITRVLAQDGFAVRRLGLEREEDLLEHLRNDWMALPLIRRPLNGNLHWVLLQRGRGRDVEVVDSLEEEPYGSDVAEFLREQAVTVFPVKPATGDAKEAIKAAHRLGVEALKETPGRVRELERP